MRIEALDGDKTFLVHDFMTREECEAHIAFVDSQPLHKATINAGYGHIIENRVRNNDRLIVDDEGMAQALWERARGLFGQVYGEHPIGFNERFRYYRYGPGQQFKLHCDGSHRRDNGDESFYTFLIYLNEGFVGGSTTFYDHDMQIVHKVRPRQGMALVFLHPQMHEGRAMREGVKYVLRTDVMYARYLVPA